MQERLPDPCMVGPGESDPATPLQRLSRGPLRRHSPGPPAELWGHYRAAHVGARRRWSTRTRSTTATGVPDLGGDDRSDVVNEGRDHCPGSDPAEAHFELVDMVGLFVAMKAERDKLGGIGAEQRERLAVHCKGTPRGQDRILRL